MDVEEVTPISTKISRRKKKTRGNRPPLLFFLFFEVITEDIDDRE